MFPRLVGALAVVYAAIFQRGALDWASDWQWLGFTVLWLSAAVLLLLARHQAVAGGLLAVLCLIFWIGPGRHLHDGTALLGWLAISIALTDGRPHERALLVRLSVTVVYAFSALAKLNPSFLTGEQIEAITIDRSQLNWLTPSAQGSGGVLIAWTTVATEAGLAVALWFGRTRVPAALAGGLLHLIFVVAANNGTVWDIAFVTVLNMGLVAGYLAFFSPAAWREPAIAALPERSDRFRATG